jgi:hypothetical protein
MKTIFGVIFTVSLGFSQVALSQDVPQTPPSDTEYDSQRFTLLNEQNKFLTMTILRDRAQAKETAAWWAEVWKALPDPNKVGVK